MAKKLMKLYVWEKVLWDYSSGMIVALAPDMETALAMAREQGDWIARDMGEVAPEVKLWHVHGGG